MGKKMKTINPSLLPHFLGLFREDPDNFMSEFVVVYITYNYTIYEHKLKLFPSTLKDAIL